MTMRKGLPAKLALTDADDTRYDFVTMVTTNADGTVRQGITSPVGTALVTGTATMNVAVAAFSAIAARDGGAILLANDGSVNVLIATAPVSNSRWDLICARQDDASSTVVTPDGDNLAKLYVVQGTAAASPAVPALPAGSVEIGRVLVSAGNVNTNAMTISQATQYTASVNSRIPFRDFTSLSAWTTARQGQFAYDMATGITWRWYNIYNASTNPSGRATAGWKPWETAVPVDYYAAANLVNYTVGPDVPIMTWSARAGRIICEGKLAIVSGSSFAGAFAIKVPSTIPVAAKYAATGRQDIVGKALYIASSQFPIDVVLQGSTATDRVLPILENQAGTYPAYATQITASVPVANAIGYVLTWAFEYDPA